MATIKTVIDGDLTMRFVSGIVTADEIVAVLQESYAGTPTLYTVWNITRASISGFSPEDIERITHAARERAELRTGGKSAVIATADLEFGISRMVDIGLDLRDTPYEVRSFRTADEARTWLGVDSLPVEPED